VSDLFPSKVLLKSHLYSLNTNLRIKDLRRKSSAELIQSLVGRESFGLDFILVSLLIQGETLPSDGSIDSGTKVSIFINDISLFTFNLNVLSGLIHLSQDFDPFSLDLG
jgi:hypothetical protein